VGASDREILFAAWADRHHGARYFIPWFLMGLQGVEVRGDFRFHVELFVGEVLVVLLGNLVKNAWLGVVFGW
jgi:hypothetical protein